MSGQTLSCVPYFDLLARVGGPAQLIVFTRGKSSLGNRDLGYAGRVWLGFAYKHEMKINKKLLQTQDLTKKCHPSWSPSYKHHPHFLRVQGILKLKKKILIHFL